VDPNAYSNINFIEPVVKPKSGGESKRKRVLELVEKRQNTKEGMHYKE
jgi:hypothetical protein